MLSQSQTKYKCISAELVDRRERYLSIHVDTFGYILIRIDTLSIRDGTQRTHAALSHYVRYEQLRSGVMPRGVNYNWEKACDVKNSMCRVEVDMDTSHILECGANPHNFKCSK